MAYQQVCFYFIKLHMLMLMTGREQSKRHQKPKQRDQRTVVIQKKMKKYIWAKRGRIRVRRNSTEKKDTREGCEQTKWKKTLQGKQDWHWNEGEHEDKPGSMRACEDQRKRAAEFLPKFCSCLLINKYMEYAKVKPWITDFHLLCNRIPLVKPVLSLAVHVVDLFSQPSTNHCSL